MDQLFKPQKQIEFQQDQAWKRWTKSLIILGVFGISVLLPAIGSEEQMLLVVFLLAGVLGVVTLLHWPVIGLFGILIGGFFVGYSGPGGINVSVVGVAGVSGLWIVDMIVRQRKISVVDTRVNLPIIIFFLSALLSFGIGQLPWYPMARHAPLTAQLGGLAIFILSGFAFLLVGNLMRDLRWLRAFTWLFVAIGAIFIIARIVPAVARITDHFFQIGATAQAIFWVWLLVIPFSQALLNRDLHKGWRIALAALVLGVLYVSIIQSYDWKSGFLPPLVGMAAIIALLLGRRVLWLIPAAAMAVVYVGIQGIASDQYSWITRLEAWRIVIQLSAVNPLFGIGFANYYWYTHLIPILGWRVSFNSHSQYVDIFSQTGLLGLICFFWIFWEIGKLGWYLKDRAPQGFARAYVYGALGGLMGTLAAGGFVDWILPFAYNIGMNGFRSSVIAWLFLGGLVTINQVVKRTSVPDTKIPSIMR